MTQILAKIISELTKAEESANVTSEQVLPWAKRVEVQRAQSAVITSLSEIKELDKIQTVGDEQKQNGRKLHTPVKTTMKQNCKYCGIQPSTQMIPNI